MSTPHPLPAHEVSGSGELTLFLLHGAYGDGRYFANTRDWLVAQGHRVVVWHCPGYGGSPGVSDPSIEAFGEAAAELIEATGSERNIILGHSMGGRIAPRAAVLAADRVHGLVLSSTTAGLNTRTPEEQAQFMAERVDPITAGMSVGEYAPELIKTMMGPDASGSLVDTVMSVICEMNTETFKLSMAAIASYTDGIETLQKQTVPVLLIAGELDPACPPAGMQYMAELLPDAEYAEIAGVGHYGFAERPDEYHQLIERFLASRFAN
ncbi:MAG: alpha/beta hydrolase [Allobranchiibius sp.]